MLSYILTKEWPMNSLFNFKCLDVVINPKFKNISLFVTSPKINETLLSEMESFFDWLATHKEINSVLISMQQIGYLESLDSNDLKHYNAFYLREIQNKIQKINSYYKIIPQTIIYDYGTKACGLAFELGIDADLKIAHQKSFFQLNHFQLGILPSSGTVETLSLCSNQSTVKNLLLLNKKMTAKFCENIGFISQIYKTENEQKTISTILETISKSSQVSIAQFKMTATLQNKSLKSINQDEQVKNATYIIEDWKEPSNFMPLKSFACVVQKTFKIDEDEKLAG
jgi:enoyl-CoA hydratase/carnithine racemase